MTLNREELEQLKTLLDKICDGQEDCSACPMGYQPRSGSAMCLEDRILERVEARIKLKEQETSFDNYTASFDNYKKG